MGHENFDLGEVKIEVWLPSGQLASVHGPVSLSESVSLVNYNFRTETISKLKTAR